MLTMNATDVRKEWSTVLDNTIRQKPQFIKRTRDYLMLADIRFLDMILSNITYTAAKFIEDDGSTTLSLENLDLIENAPTEKEAIIALSKSILEYSEDFYNEFNLMMSAPNRKGHVPYVFKALILNDITKIGELIVCHDGEN